MTKTLCILKQINPEGFVVWICAKYHSVPFNKELKI